MNKKFIIIINAETSETIVAEYDENIYEDYQEFYEFLNETQGMNITESNSDCMIISGPMQITYI
jgi:hypothetical protein